MNEPGVYTEFDVVAGHEPEAIGNARAYRYCGPYSDPLGTEPTLVTRSAGYSGYELWSGTRDGGGYTRHDGTRLAWKHSRQSDGLITSGGDWTAAGHLVAYRSLALASTMPGCPVP